MGKCRPASFLPCPTFSSSLSASSPAVWLCPPAWHTSLRCLSQTSHKKCNKVEVGACRNALVESAKPEFAIVDRPGQPEDTMNWLGKALSMPFKLPTEAEFTSFDKNHDGRVSKMEWMAACP